MRGVLHKLLLDWNFPTDPHCLKRYPVSDSSLGKNVLLGIKQRSEYFKLPLAATEVCRRASWNATRSILADSFALVRSPFSSGPLGSIGSHFLGLIHQAVPEEFWRCGGYPVPLREAPVDRQCRCHDGIRGLA